MTGSDKWMVTVLLAGTESLELSASHGEALRVIDDLVKNKTRNKVFFQLEFTNGNQFGIDMTKMVGYKLERLS